MRGLIRRAAVAAGAAVVLLGAAAGVAAQANATPAASVGAAVPGWSTAPGWSITPSPNPRAGNGALTAVSCPTTSACTAVGAHVTASGLRVTLAERHSGGGWAVQPTPNPPGAAASALLGVSCPSGSACTAVGDFFAGSGAQLTLAERWDGTRWVIQPTPNPAGSPLSTLVAVACPAAHRCTAVGTANSRLLVERWGGASWRIQSAPVPPGAQFSELNGVSCTAASSCIAVGDYVTSSGVDVTLAERWNGTRWSIQPTPNPAGVPAAVLFAVSCTSGSSCMAVGTSFNSSGPVGIFSERWNGASWSLQAAPVPAGAQGAQLLGVSCAASSCEAVGGYVDSSGAFVPLGEQWNGAAWSAQPVPDPARASTNYLKGVSCPSPSDCTAAGLGNQDGTPITLGERWNGTRWSLEAVPSPIGAAENQLNGIACPATNACIAVGIAGPTRGVVSTEALRWNGRAWRLQHIPALPGTGLNAVSCVSETDCVAVGGPGAGALAERWDGAKWTVQPTPKPTGAQLAAFNAVWCAAASSCMAAGGYMDATGGIHVLTERWNGHAWSVVPAVTPSSQPNNFFAGVACPASSACIGVGGSFTNDPNAPSTGSFAERWNGHAWTLQPTPTQSTPGGFLGGVWCKSATACIATGSTNAGTLAERLSGTTWSVLPTPNPPGTQGDFLNNVSCTSLSACTSAGLAFGAPGGFPPQTLAERWNGTRWRIQPTPLLPGVSDISNFSVACPAQSSCIAVGGFKNDLAGSKTLTERWRGSGTSDAPTAPAFSPRAYLGIAGCIRAAIGEGFEIGAAVTRPGPTITALMPLRPRPASGIEKIASRCGVA